MDLRLFASDAPGRLVPIEGGERAFVPEPLTPNWEFPTRLWPLLAEAKAKLMLLEGIGRTLPNPAILLRPLEDREALRSSQLEGTHATPRELLLFDKDGGAARTTGEVDAQREVYNYRQALHAGLASELPLSLRLITDLHRVLLSGVRGQDRSPGKFRQVQVYLGSDKRFIPPPPHLVRESLEALEKHLHRPDRTTDPLVECFRVYYQFETIHPFVDGNGRVGRLLMSLMLQQWCGLTKPWLYLSEYFEQHKDEYVDRLFNISARADWASWIEFCLRATAVQAQNAVERCDKLLKTHATYKKRLQQVGGSERLHQMVDSLFDSPFVRVADLARRFDVTYPTAKADIERLVKAKILANLPTLSPATYFARDIYNIAYHDLGAATD